MDAKLWLFILLAAVSTAIYVLLIKYYVKHKNLIIIILIILILVVCTWSYYKVFNSQNISIAYPVIKALAIIIVVFVGLILFQEHPDIKGFIGIFLIIIGILLLSSI